MKVLITTPDIEGIGGIQQYCRNIRQTLKSEAEFFTVGSRKRQEGALYSAARSVFDVVRYVLALAGKEYDLVHLNPSLRSKALIREGALLLIAWAFRKPVIVFIHGWEEKCERMIRGPWRSVFEAVYSRAKAVIVLNKAFKEALVEIGLRTPIWVESTSVSEDVFQVASQPYDGAGPFRLLFMGRVEAEKGIYEALDVYANVKRSNPNATLTIAGDGHELANVKRRVDDECIPDVEFLGYVQGTKKCEALRKSHAFLLLTRWGEGMPVAVLEAMACGLPVITRRVGGIADFFVDRRMGFLVSDSTAAVDSVRLLMTDQVLYRTIRDANRRFATVFSASTCADRIERIYAVAICGDVSPNNEPELHMCWLQASALDGPASGPTCASAK